jgi:hypothetical protein
LGQRRLHRCRADAKTQPDWAWRGEVGELPRILFLNIATHLHLNRVPSFGQSLAMKGYMRRLGHLPPFAMALPMALRRRIGTLLPESHDATPEIFPRSPPASARGLCNSDRCEGRSLQPALRRLAGLGKAPSDPSTWRPPSSRPVQRLPGECCHLADRSVEGTCMPYMRAHVPKNGNRHVKDLLAC